MKTPQALGLLLGTLLSTCFGCKSQPVKFSQSEISIFNTLNFDREVFQGLKKYTKQKFTQYESSDPGYSLNEKGEKEYSDIQKQAGISFKIAESKSDEILSKFKESLKAHGYILFFSERDFEKETTISVIQSTDQLDIIRFQKTDGINYDVLHADVIQKLKEWDTRFGIDIIGADYDWVDLRVQVPEDSISAFSKEVYEFCPDSVEQGMGTVEALEQSIRDFQRLFLW